MASMIVDPADFIPAEHILFTKPKINAKGGKSIGIINSATKRFPTTIFPSLCLTMVPNVMIMTMEPISL